MNVVGIYFSGTVQHKWHPRLSIVCIVYCWIYNELIILIKTTDNYIWIFNEISPNLTRYILFNLNFFRELQYMRYWTRRLLPGRLLLVIDRGVFFILHIRIQARFNERILRYFIILIIRLNTYIHIYIYKWKIQHLLWK